MSLIRHPLEQAANKRELARTIRKTALTLPRGILRERIIRQAERLEKEAEGIEVMARTTRRPAQ